MTKFSANLGFLWTELSLPDAIRAAHKAGFDAVEFHWPFETPIDDVKSALSETGLRLMGLNTRRGDVAAGDTGLAAQTGREAEARVAIDEAIAYAAACGAGAVHVMAGIGEGAAARATFEENLRYACDLAVPHNLTILIEPLNKFDAPGYFLNTTDQAREIIGAVGHPNLKLMFDCYHVGRTEGDVVERFGALQKIVGHVQFAAVPDRGAPDHGDLDYQAVFSALEAQGWDAPLGAEYRPDGPTQNSLDWMNAL